MRDRKRLFIAIDISHEVRGHLKEFKDRWYDFPGKWVHTNILHMTLSFLGNIKESDIPELLEAIEGVASECQPFRLEIKKIDFDIKDGKLPRKIVAQIGESDHLNSLYRNVSDELMGLSFAVHSQRPRISAHITLCRLNSFSLAKWHGDEMPEIAEDVNISFPVSTIDLMESKLRRGGPEYFVLQSFPLGA